MLKPLDARVLVKKPERQEQTESGIFLPDTAAEQGQTALGEVLAVGPGSRNMNTGEPMPMDIEVGDTNGDFAVYVKTENLVKVLPAEYKVTVSDSNVICFQNDTHTYWIVSENRK